MMSSGKPSFWREAASLILTVPRGRGKYNDGPAHGRQGTDSDSDIDVLMLKRGKKSSFMANVYVFPGGVASGADFDARGWTHIFQRITGNSMATTAGEFRIDGPRPPMMKKDDESGRYLAPEVAFRICAIRETFEESGILLVTNKSYIDASPTRSRRLGSPLQDGLPRVSAMPSTFSAAVWRQKVSNDAEKFQTLCDEYDVVPNVWALTEWCNWLTPVFQKVVNPPPKPKRFDTMFFICCLDEIPDDDTQLHTEEISSVEWDSPDSWYGRGRDKAITLVGPQYYEISRLASFHGTRDILNYASTREPLGLPRWMSVSYICQDGIFFTLPGDELYPDEPDYEGVRDLSVLDEAVLSNCHKCKHFHRGIRGTWDYYCNVSLPYGLLAQTNAKRTFPEHLDLRNSRM